MMKIGSLSRLYRRELSMFRHYSVELKGIKLVYCKARGPSMNNSRLKGNNKASMGRGTDDEMIADIMNGGLK